MMLEFDFIVVGGGPAGCVLASRLANHAPQPNVLLLEAGGPNKDVSYLIPAHRFTLAFTDSKLNWGYKTAPQTHLKGQEIDYSRGRGLGGSTAINFCCWAVGADEDYDEWARRVDDEWWTWDRVQERVKRIETYHCEVPKEHRKYLNPKQSDHGTSGPLHLSYADPVEKGLADSFIAAEEVGMGVNPDINSGNPIGMGLGAGCLYKGQRTTAAAYLQDAPPNLTILTDSPVAKILFEGKRAAGVRTIDGREFGAQNELIISAGALNSPQILMLSGIGPAAELEKHNIPVIHDLPEVGKNLQDHCFSTATLLLKPGTNDRMAYETDPEAVKAAKEQYDKDKTGRLAELYTAVPMGWFKSEEVYGSEEFRALSDEQKEYLGRKTVPSFEIATHVPPLFTGDYVLQPTDSYLTALAFVMNPQSHGTVTLSSSNPADPPIINPNLLSHPYDRRVIISAMRKMLEYLEAPVFKKNTVKMIGVPKSKSDEDIWDHVSGNLHSSWHMCSTVRMGRKDDTGACVDTDFRVRGVQALRVVDLSVIPLLPNNHTQSTAYLVGETAAEKMIREYGFDR